MAGIRQDTIFAPATLPGTGAISILRISGPDCFSMLDSIVQLKRGSISESKGYSIHYGCVWMAGGALLDEVLVAVFRSPHSYTGEDSAEISFHASPYIASELMALLSRSGARMADPGEFTQRAFLVGKMDLAQAEAVADVISSSTSAAHRIAVNQLRGGYSRELAELRSELLEMTSLMELELDFSEEDVEFADRSHLDALLGKALAHLVRLAGSFHAGNAIKNGVPVAIVGPPNAGKSTLLNALLGDDRAIVSDIPGTTRDTVEEVFNLDGVLYRFIDTAGIRQTDEVIEQIGIERAIAKISTADIVIPVLDASAGEASLLGDLQSILPRSADPSQKWIFVLNKTDLVDEKDINKNVTVINNSVSSTINQYIVITSVLNKGQGLDRIRQAISSWSETVLSEENSTFVTNQRHFDALNEVISALTRVRSGLAARTPTDLLAEDLRSAITSLSRITGHAITPDEILGNIFGKFCIGK